ncbi:MucBP domain-containing protein [Levilactobacillus brevis]|nr:MucBP domain-containing protein [Levilactobacillus brevis]
MTNSPSATQRGKTWLYAGVISAGLGLGLLGTQSTVTHAATTDTPSDLATTDRTTQEQEVTLKPATMPADEAVTEAVVDEPTITEEATVDTTVEEPVTDPDVSVDDENVSGDTNVDVNPQPSVESEAAVTSTPDTSEPAEPREPVKTQSTPAATAAKAATTVAATPKATPQVKADIDQWMPNETLQDLVWQTLKHDNKDRMWASAKDVTQEDMLLLTRLSAQTFLVSLYIDGQSEFSLEGLQYATNLVELDLYNSLNIHNNAMRGDIVDISPLSALVNLEYLQLGGSRIKDITPIANLTKITDLSIGTNCIADFSALDSQQYTQRFNIEGQVLDQELVYVNKKTRTYTLKNPMKAPQGMTLSFGTVGTVMGIPIFPIGVADKPLARIYYNGAANQKLVGDQIVYSGIVDQVMPGVTTSPFPGYGAYPSDYKYYLISTYVTANGSKVINMFTPYVLADEAQPVTVNYVDDQGKKLKDPVTLTGMVGENYAAVAETFDGYTLTKTPDNAKGQFGEEAITVTFVYQKDGDVTPPVDPQPDTTVTITVQFLTADGVKVAADQILTGKPGQSYTTSPADVDGNRYVLVSTPANASGMFGDSDDTVTYLYEEVVDDGDGDQVTTDPDVVAPGDDDTTGGQVTVDKPDTTTAGQGDQILTTGASATKPQSARQPVAAKTAQKQAAATLPQTDERAVSPIWGVALLLGLAGFFGFRRKR